MQPAAIEPVYEVFERGRALVREAYEAVFFDEVAVESGTEEGRVGVEERFMDVEALFGGADENGGEGGVEEAEGGECQWRRILDLR